MKQYWHFKRKYPDYILFFRMGDFYEMFYDDAKIACRVLGLALTSRSKGPDAVPLAGIPYHAVDSYLAKMIKAGYRVAICEQVEDPKEAKGVVKRDVVRLVSPGTLTEESLLDEREGNYLLAIFDPNDTGAGSSKWSVKKIISSTCDEGSQGAARSSSMVGLAWVELSSGVFEAAVIKPRNVVDELIRIHPAEVLLPEGSSLDTREFRERLKEYVGAVMTPTPPWSFELASAERALKEHFGVSTLAGFGFDNYDASLSAAGAIIDYLQQTQKTALGHIRTLRRFNRSDYVIMDGNTIRCLEILRTLRSNQRTGTLVSIVDATRTGMGARLLERWLTAPLRSYSAIVARQDAVEELFCDKDKLSKLRDMLGGMSQIDRISSNIVMARVRPRELLGLAETLNRLPEISRLLSDSKAEILSRMPADFAGLDEPAELIDRAISPDAPAVLRDGGVIADGFDEELDRLRRIDTDGQNWLIQYQQQESQRTGIANLKIGYNKVFGYYIEVKRSDGGRVPPDYVRKQTLKNAERYITEPLKRYETEALTAAERAKALEMELFEQVRVQLAGWVDRFQVAADALARLDVLAGFAHLAIERGYRRPVITQDNVLHIVNGKHPVLAEALGSEFVPNDVHIEADKDRLLIITGPNMSGKSTYIRQTALLVLLAQTGCFIPAEEATIGIVDRIFTRVGAADEIAAGLSTFMVEMIEVANILNNATSRSLVILDEVGRGTSTYDGLALAWAVCEHIAMRIKCRTLFATHYHELTELEGLIDGVANLNVAVREWADEVVFLHKIVPGGTDRSYGVHVARLAGVPKDVIERAKEILPRLQAHLAEGLNMPELAKRAKKLADQMILFADPASVIAQKIKEIDLNSITPLEALEYLKQFKQRLEQ